MPARWDAGQLNFKDFPDHGRTLKTGCRATVLHQNFKRCRYFRKYLPFASDSITLLYAKWYVHASTDLSKYVTVSLLS